VTSPKTPAYGFCSYAERVYSTYTTINKIDYSNNIKKQKVYFSTLVTDSTPCHT
jgi:hypothetical protein